jgi:transposase
MLREDLAAPRKQRHIARRVFERLADEHGAQVSCSYVAKYVARRRAEIAALEGGGAAGLAGFVPQVREPGAEAEADFGDVTVELAGQLTRCFMFAFRLLCSGKGVHRVYASQAQEAFLDGHVTAFEVTGGVPWRQIRYDNLSAAVTRVLTGRSRPGPPRVSTKPGAVQPANMTTRPGPGELLDHRPWGIRGSAANSVIG